MRWLESLRNFADPGQEWVQEFRDGQWTNIGDIRLVDGYSQVSYSVDSCCNWGRGDPVFVILRSYDLTALRTLYFGLSISKGNDEIRIYVQRTETMDGKFNNQKTLGPTVVSMRDASELLTHFPQIEKLSKRRHYYVTDENSWVYRMMRLLD
jgi:hypothetical protein